MGLQSGEDAMSMRLGLKLDGEPPVEITVRSARGVHDDGHTSGLTPAGLRHMSTRSGSLPRRIAKRVYFPMSPGLETRISRVTPKRKERSNPRNSTGETPRLLDTTTRPADLIGQPRPLHLTVICAPAGTCCTLSSLSLTPEAVSVPAIRTTGNGCMRGAVGLTTLIVS